jgi:FMN-dependent NADH-azoreductase
MTGRPQRILRIDSSARYEGSVTRELTGRLVERLSALAPGAEIIERDLGPGVPVVTEVSVGAYFTPPDQRDPAQHRALAPSDALVEELRSADVLVLGVPMYNFTVPAALKAYFDLVARVGLTFRYTEQGPVGLLSGKSAYVVVSTAGVEVGSTADYTTDYVRQFLGFLGITEVQVVAADLLLADAGRLDLARQRIDALAAA